MRAPLPNLPKSRKSAAQVGRLPLRLAGNSLLEVVLAMGLMSLIFLLGSRLWTQTVMHASPSLKQEAHFQVRALLHEGPMEIGTKEWKKNRLKYIRYIMALPENPNLLHISVYAYRGTQLVAEQHRFVRPERRHPL